MNNETTAATPKSMAGHVLNCPCDACERLRHGFPQDWQVCKHGRALVSVYRCPDCLYEAAGATPGHREWKLEPDCSISRNGKTIIDKHGILWNFGEGPANAQFIVRACNSHEALLSACKALARFDRVPSGAELEAARLAIAKAEGKL